MGLTIKFKDRRNELPSVPDLRKINTSNKNVKLNKFMLKLNG